MEHYNYYKLTEPTLKDYQVTNFRVNLKMGTVEYNTTKLEGWYPTYMDIPQFFDEMIRMSSQLGAVFVKCSSKEKPVPFKIPDNPPKYELLYRKSNGSTVWYTDCSVLNKDNTYLTCYVPVQNDGSKHGVRTFLIKNIKSIKEQDKS